MRELLACLPIAALLLSAPPANGQSGAGKEASASPATSVWGEAYYQAAAEDSNGNAVTSWAVSQEAGLSLNLRSPGGLEFVGEFTLPLGGDLDLSPQAHIPQLFVRVSPAAGVSLSAGKQRLNWGTAKVFSAIDTLEVRANPLDVRSILSGVTGLKADFIPSDRISASLVVLPGSDIRWSRAAARLDFLEESLGLDLGLGAVKYTYFERKVAPGADPLRFDALALLSDGAWSIGPVVVYGEVQLRWGRETGYMLPGMTEFDDLGGRSTAVFRGAGGIMLQVDLGLTRPASVLTEYFYNGDGLSTTEARRFASRLESSQASGSSGSAQIPGVFAGLGGFRRHYISAALRDVALDRALLLSIMGILGIDSMLSQLSLGIEWEVSPRTSIGLRADLCHAFLDPADQPTELLVIPFNNRVTLSFSTSY